MSLSFKTFENCVSYMPLMHIKAMIRGEKKPECSLTPQRPAPHCAGDPSPARPRPPPGPLSFSLGLRPAVPTAPRPFPQPPPAGLRRRPSGRSRTKPFGQTAVPQGGEGTGSSASSRAAAEDDAAGAQFRGPRGRGRARPAPAAVLTALQGAAQRAPLRLRPDLPDHGEQRVPPTARRRRRDHGDRPRRRLHGNAAAAAAARGHWRAALKAPRIPP